jgi:spore germination cell wall hydrolase CwlJ-like protein
MIRPLAGLSIEQQPEGVVSRMGVYGEARGESAVGAAGVWFVARNRAIRYVTDIKHQFLRPRQFSCFNPEDPNRGKLLEAHRADPAGWARADAVCELCESSFLVDPTHGATHYYNPAVCDPPWGRRHPDWRELAVIGAHSFGVTA